MTIPTTPLLKKMEVLILVESWRSSSPCSLLFLLQLSSLSSSHLSSPSFSPLWLVFSPWLSPSRLPSSTLFFPPLAFNSATSTEPPYRRQIVRHRDSAVFPSRGNQRRQDQHHHPVRTGGYPVIDKRLRKVRRTSWCHQKTPQVLLQ